jgi:hypothetical protein
LKAHVHCRRPPAGAALLVALATVAPWSAEADDERRRWFVPDHAKLQLAGEIGFVSPGVGYELANRKVHLDAFFGWVPEAVGGQDIFSLTTKLSYAPWRERAGRDWRVQPLIAGVQLTYTFGSQYFLRQPSRYPDGYYDLPTALHAGVSIGGSVTRKLRDGRELGVYYELVAIDQMLRAWIENPDAIAAGDVVSLAIGTRFRF